VLLDETSISFLESLGHFCKNFIAWRQLYLAFIYLTTASVYFLFPFTADIEGFFKIKTLQQFLGKEGSDIAWKIESLFHNMFYLGAHASIIA